MTNDRTGDPGDPDDDTTEEWRRSATAAARQHDQDVARAEAARRARDGNGDWT